MTAGFFVAYNLPELATVRIYDNSEYTTALPVTSVNATRLLFATVQTINNIQDNVTELIAWKQYQVVSGEIEINGVTYQEDDLIYLAAAYTVSSEDVSISETGYYGIRSTYLPTTNYVAYTPSQLIYGQTDTNFPDVVITLKYELYTTKTAAGSVTVSEETQFIVIGTEGDSISIGGETYYVGEGFTKDSTFTFSNDSGTNYVVALESSVEENFRTWGQNWQIWSTYFNTIATSYQVTPLYMANFLKVTANINACALYENQQFGVSLDGVQALLDEVIFNLDPG